MFTTKKKTAFKKHVSLLHWGPYHFIYAYMLNSPVVRNIILKVLQVISSPRCKVRK